MQEIYLKEEQVILQAEELIEHNKFASEEDLNTYKVLCEEYKKLLKHMKTVVKLSDLMQLELKNVSEKLTIASQTDSLTELYNKRYFNEIYQKEWFHAISKKSVLSMIMIDIDHFKKYNDTYGHLLGDECLKAVAKEIQKTVTVKGSLVARFGGEEFVILLPNTDIPGASLIAQDLVSNIVALSIEHKGSTIYNIITISVGVASASPMDGEFMDVLLKNADHALYEAKNSGRNCYKVSGTLTKFLQM
ncbi:MAG: diguanylate cyclase domain protein [Herbinix sp.]|jgi:diguanylate cyclase (GGDEF)-like protein|nr:diguanylate cyclase domain protein [Herbinix sp.]